MGRVGGGQCNCVRVWIHFPTEEACVRYYGTTGPGSLAKGDKGCTRAKLPLLLAEYLIFFSPLSTTVGTVVRDDI